MHYSCDKISESLSNYLKRDFMRLSLNDFKERQSFILEDKVFQVFAPEKAKLFCTKSILANGGMKFLKRSEEAFLKEHNR